ncbi:MAG: glycoside hydrolase family 3 N-terminal domain-containing protein [Candidatus Limnocylindrales bacterium]
MRPIRRARGARSLALVAAVLLIAACDASTPTSTPTPTSPTSLAAPSATGGGPTSSASSAPTAKARLSATARPSSTRAPSIAPSAVASCATRTLASLTEAQRIGQLFVLGLTDDQLDTAERTAISQYHFGSMTMTTGTKVGVTAIHAVTSAVQRLASPAATGGVGFFVAANQEGGLIQGLAGPGFDTIPTALAQGSMSPAALKTAATRWGKQLAAAGINLNFAPVADTVPPGTDQENAPIGRLKREYGHDPQTVASHVAAFIAGMRAAGIDTTAKHFPGLGRVVGNTDDTADVVDTVTTPTDPYLDPFGAAVQAGTPFVMVSLATYTKIDPNDLAVFSPTIITGMLRGDLGFRGVVISDSLGAAAVASIPPATRGTDFVAAGGDMIISNLIPAAVGMAQGIAARAATDPAFRALVDAATIRVLKAKDAAGLLPCD